MLAKRIRPYLQKILLPRKLWRLLASFTCLFARKVFLLLKMKINSSNNLFSVLKSLFLLGKYVHKWDLLRYRELYWTNIPVRVEGATCTGQERNWEQGGHFPFNSNVKQERCQKIKHIRSNCTCHRPISSDLPNTDTVSVSLVTESSGFQTCSAEFSPTLWINSDLSPFKSQACFPLQHKRLSVHLLTINKPGVKKKTIWLTPEIKYTFF